MSNLLTKSKHEDLFYTVAGRLIQIAVGLATLRIQTHYLPREEVGEYGLYLNITTIFVFMTFRPVNQYFSRRLHAWFEGGAMSAALRKNILLQFALSVVSMPIIAAGAAIFGVHSSHDRWTWALVWALWYFFNSLFNIAIPALNLLGLKKEWLKYNSLGILLSLFAAWASASLWQSAFAWTIALTLGFALSSAMAIIALLRLSPQTGRKEQPGPVAPFDFIIPATLAIGGTWIQFQAFRLLAADFMSLSEYGLFTAGYGLAASLMGSFEGLVAQYLLPFFYGNLDGEIDAAGKGRTWRIFLGISLSLMAATCILAFIFGKFLCALLLSKDFAAAWPYFFLGIFIESIRVVSGSAALGTHITLQVYRSLRSYSVGIIALAAGYGLGKYLGSFTPFAVTLLAGCAFHLAFMIRDVSSHLGTHVHLPAIGLLSALLCIGAGYLAILLAGANWAWAAAAMTSAAVTYMALLFKLNQALIQPH